MLLYSFTIPYSYFLYIFTTIIFYSIDETGKDKIKKRHGQGVYINGPESYSGSWDMDTMNGLGIYKFSSGAIFEGNFSCNSFEGMGKYVFPEGATYEGVWKNNKMHGQGTYTDKDGIKFTGQFFNGLYDSGASYIELR